MSGTFDDVRLICRGNLPGPRFLRALGDHRVRLAAKPDEDGTIWRRGVLGHTWTLRCISAAGEDPRDRLYLFAGHDGRVTIAPPPPALDGLPQAWHAREVPGQPTRFTLENITLLGTGVAARFLDGRTATGDVGFAPNTAPPFTGTVWDIDPVPTHHFME